MTNTNVVVLKGNITRDLDENSFGYTNNGTARANIAIAVNRSRKQGDEWIDDVSYFDITVWGKTAENLKPYFVKGATVLVNGYLKQDRWEKDGQKYSRVTVIANSIELCGGKKDAGTNSESKPSTSNQQKNNKEEYQEDSFLSDPEDIPF